MKVFRWLVFALVIMCIFISCTDDLDVLNREPDGKTKLSEMECYNSFEEFAYIFPEVATSTSPLLPNEPWLKEKNLPSEWVGDYNISGLGIDVMFSRIVEDNPEIWLARPRRYREEDIKSVLIYRPLSKEWDYVPDSIEGANIFIGEIFQTSDGAIWGENRWWGDDVSPKRGSVLSKFNDQVGQFEFASGALEIPYSGLYSFTGFEILLDEQDVFWFLLENDGIYRYDPFTNTTSKQADLSNIVPTGTTLAIDGSIYFKDLTYDKFVAADPMYSLYDGLFYQFFPDTGELVKIETPAEPWPMGRIFVTQTNHLWFGAVGYKNLNDGSWHLLHPDPDYHFELGYWSHSPKIILESSNGLLWFNKYTDMYVGTAWYDPETDDGCMFTNIEANIIEDDQQQLWMFADGKLYRYALED